MEINNLYDDFINDKISTFKTVRDYVPKSFINSEKIYTNKIQIHKLEVLLNDILSNPAVKPIMNINDIYKKKLSQIKTNLFYVIIYCLKYKSKFYNYNIAKAINRTSANISIANKSVFNSFYIQDDKHYFNKFWIEKINQIIENFINNNEDK